MQWRIETNIERELGKSIQPAQHDDDDDDDDDENISNYEKYKYY